MANVSKAAIKEKLSKMLKAKEDSIVVFGLKTKFGGGRSSGFALVYDNADAKKKYDCKSRLLNVSSPPTFKCVNVAFVSITSVLITCSCFLGETHRVLSQTSQAKEGHQVQEEEIERYCQGQGYCRKAKALNP